jgi:DNA-binding beta-propeller fold protein YncE
MPRASRVLLVAAATLPVVVGAVTALTPLSLPGGGGGIGLDDLNFSPKLNRVLVPSGRTGLLNLVDTKTRAIESISGFSSEPSAGGHGGGTTSADFGRGFVFASDRTLKAVDIVDTAIKRILGSTKLEAGPDYVRWVEPNSEVWVTEPGRKGIEYFKFTNGASPALMHGGAIDVADGPEALAIDATRGRAYTLTRHDTAIAIDLKTHTEVARWPNGCAASRGLALDEARGLLFVGCEEGRVATLDVAHAGKVVAAIETGGKGVDIIAYSPSLSHLYVPGGESATMAILGVGVDGGLKVLGTVPTAPSSHCVTADDLGNAYVCAPKSGQLLVFADTFPKEK